MEYLGKNHKKILILVIAIIAILIIGIVYYMHIQKNNKEIGNANIEQDGKQQEMQDIWKKPFKEVEDYDIYYSVKGILNNYIIKIKEANGDEYIEFGRLSQSKEEAISILIEESINSIYNMFDDEYTEKNNITKETIHILTQSYKQQGDYSKNIQYDFKINKMYVANISSKIKFVLTNFTINGMEDKILVKLDLENNTYSIFGQEYLKDKGYDETIDADKMEINQDNIVPNDYNQFNFVNTDDKYIVNQYFSNYQTKLLTNIKEAYNSLDKEYKENKYENPKEFQSYVEENRNSFQNMYLSKYMINEFDEYKEYVCLDENNHYYIFIEKSLTEYSVILDTYTIDLKDFTDKYKKADIPTKVGMNVEKMITAINDKDSRYVYNKLNEAFRNNTFGNIDNFKTYINENFYENNELKYLEFSEEGDTYIYKAKIKNAQEENSEGKNMTIVMKLLEGTDFVMSFSIE